MAGRKGLTQDAGIEAIYALIRHGRKSVIACIVGGHCLLIQNARSLRGIRDDRDLALVNDGIKLIGDHAVQDFTKMLEAEAFIKRVFGNADANKISLAGMHNTFQIVEPGMDLTFDDRLEIRLHLRACDLDQGRNVCRTSVDVGTDDGNLMILYCIERTALDKLTARMAACPEFSLHIGLTDDFALECRSERNGDRKFLGLDLDAA